MPQRGEELVQRRVEYLKRQAAVATKKQHVQMHAHKKTKKHARVLNVMKKLEPKQVLQFNPPPTEVSEDSIDWYDEETRAKD